LCSGGWFTFEYPNGGRVVIDSSRSLQRSSDDGGGRDEIVGEGVVEVALQLENILDLVEFLLISVAK
jgi:hypothetical protein